MEATENGAARVVPEVWAIAAAGEEAADAGRALPNVGRNNDRRRAKLVEAGEWVESHSDLIAAASELADLLEESLMYVEECEQFHKPSCRTLSKRIRLALARAKGVR